MSHNAIPVQHPVYENVQVPKYKLKKIDLKVYKEREKSLTLSSAIKILVTLLALVIIAQITMHSFMAKRAYTMRENEIQLVKMREESQKLEIKLDKIISPKNIHDAALKQSMIPADQIGYINLKDSTITGVK